jgi:hypothetical protein
MSTYPFAPTALKRSFGDSQNYSLDVQSSRRNGGIETRSNLTAINTVDDDWSLNLTIKSFTDKTAIDNFLKERAGKPFWFEARLYKVIERSWSWDASDIWKLSLKLEHSHRNYTGI